MKIAKNSFFALLLAGTVLPSAANAYTFATPDCTINSDGWCLGGTNMTSLLAALTNPTLFGPGGTVSTPITVVQLSDFSNLTGIDGIIVPWWNDAQAAPYSASIEAFFLAGGELFLMQDDAAHDGIGAGLGIPTSASDGTPSNGTSPLFAGPFGSASNVTQLFNVGQLSAADIAAKGGTVGGVNASGQITSAYWADGAYAPGSGRMVIFGDVDMVSVYNVPDFTTLSDNAKFGLNSVNYLISGAGAVPESATWMTMILGFGAVGGAMRARRRVSVKFAMSPG